MLDIGCPILVQRALWTDVSGVNCKVFCAIVLHLFPHNLSLIQQIFKGKSVMRKIGMSLPRRQPCYTFREQKGNKQTKYQQNCALFSVFWSWKPRIFSENMLRRSCWPSPS